jgi:hypothetical protein
MGLARYPEVTQLVLQAVGVDTLEDMRRTDEATVSHCLATGAMTMEALQWAGCDEDVVAIGALAGALHDVGKLHPTIQDLITEAHGRKFTISQAKLMSTHTVRGFLSIAAWRNSEVEVPVVDAAAYTALRHHHEFSASEYDSSPYAGICHTVQVCDVVHARLLDQSRSYRATRDGTTYTPQQIGRQIVQQYADFPPMPQGHLVPVEPLILHWVEEATRGQDPGTLD